MQHAEQHGKTPQIGAAAADHRRRPPPGVRVRIFGGVECLLHDDLADHLGGLVGLAVVVVGASLVEGHDVLVAGGVEVVLGGDGISINASLGGEKGRNGGGGPLMRRRIGMARQGVNYDNERVAF